MENITTRNATAIVVALYDHFGGISSINRYSDTIIRRHPATVTAIINFIVPADQGHNFHSPFTIEELTFVLRKTKGKSAGPD